MENGNYFENKFIIYRLWLTILPLLLCVFEKHSMRLKEKNEVLLSFSSNFTVDIKYVRFDVLLFGSNSVRFLSAANRHNNRHITFTLGKANEYEKNIKFHLFINSWLHSQPNADNSDTKFTLYQAFQVIIVENVYNSRSL